MKLRTILLTLAVWCLPALALAQGVHSPSAIWFDGTAPKVDSGTGSPEAVVTGAPGDLWIRTDGGAGTVLYIKDGGTGTDTTGWLPIAGGGGTHPVAADDGGTGQTSYAVGDLLSADTTSTLSKIADVAVGSVLVSGGVGVLPFWDATPLFTGPVTITNELVVSGAGDSSFVGDVGIGIASPDGALHVMTASAGAVAAASTGDDLVVENSGNAGISILFPDEDTGFIYFGTPSDNIVVQLNFDFPTTGMVFGTHIAGGTLSIRTDDNTEAMVIDDNQRVGIGTASPDRELEVEGEAQAHRLYLEEQASAGSSIAGQGQIWVDDEVPTRLFFTDDAGNNMLVGGQATFKSYTFAARSASSGEVFIGGFYDYPVADANLDEGSLTVVHGSVNQPYGAHAFIVSGGNGSTNGSDLVLTVTGTSITDAGVRDTGGTEVIEATAATSAVDTYFETAKKWIGAITYTLSSAGGSTFNYDFNYGLAKYEDFGNRNYTLTDLECEGLADATDSGFNIQLQHHVGVGWTYSGAAFSAGNAPIEDMNVTYSTEQDLTSGEQFAFKRTQMSDVVFGAGGEGVLIRVTTGTNNSVSYMNCHLGVLLQ